MLLELTADQESFRDTTERFLQQHAPPAELRRLRDDAAGFDADYWRRGAELGWTSLLVDEAHGGGSISGLGLVDLSLVAYEFGRRAAPGPLVPTNVVAGALSATATHPEVLDALLSGGSIATWCWTEGPPHDALGAGRLTIREDGDDLVVDGTKRPVESAGHASHLLVTGRTGQGLSQVLVPTDHPGVTIRGMEGIDLTRRFDEVTFTDVRVARDALVGQLGKADEDVERQLDHALVMATAEAVGAMQSAFDLTVEWAFDRYTFGRPLASYQALKHRYARMKTWLEAGHAITDDAAAAVATGAADAAELVSAAKAFTGEYGVELVQDCVQLHGGIGVTFEHDLHLFLRRVTVDRVLFGTPADHRARVARLLAERERAG